MSVAIEPIVTPYAMPSIMDAENLVSTAFGSMLRTNCKIDTPMGTMITAVAVFDTQAEMNAEASVACR